MQNKLDQNQIEQLRGRFHEHPLLVACRIAFECYEADMQYLLFAPEELFREAAIIIDEILGAPDEAEAYIDGLWNSLKIKIRRSVNGIPQDELNLIIGAVFYVVATVFLQHWHSFFRETIKDKLLIIAQKKMGIDPDEERRVILELAKCAEDLRRWLIEYAESGMWLTDEIETCLHKAKPTKPITPVRTIKKSPALPKGQHKAFPFISKDGVDAYRTAQVMDLFNFIKKPKAEGGPMLVAADQRDFINNFTTGTTSSTILWLGSARALHYIVSEWKKRGYIKFDCDDDIWVITSRVFLNVKGVKKDEKPTPFDSDDLGSTHNPTNITQDLEDIVEMLNPEKPSPNYERYIQNEEGRIGYPRKTKASKSFQEEENDPYRFDEFWKEQNGD